MVIIIVIHLHNIEICEKTMAKVNMYKKNGYNIIYIWENDFNSLDKGNK